MNILSFGLYAYNPSTSDVKLRISLEHLKILKFSKPTNFFVKSVSGNWVCYIDSQKYYLYIELLVDALAQILTELRQFQNLTYFLTLWHSYLTFHLVHKRVSSPYRDTCLSQVWWWLVKRCDLYPAENLHLDRQTDETAIGDCILAKISQKWGSHWWWKWLEC